MNYRHAYHAGNHADILKHVVLSRILARLTEKPSPLTVLDTHAGVGRYRLMSQEAGKTLEWQGGIGRMGEAFTSDVESLLGPYRSCLAREKPLEYPGSPALAAGLTRSTDKLIFNELHPEDHDMLERTFAHDKRVSVTRVDASVALKSKLPFPNRRGLVLVDPPFEATNETDVTAKMLRHGLQRMPTAVYLFWYPAKTRAFAEAFVAAIEAIHPPNLLQAELQVRDTESGAGLAGSGVLIINAPWKLDDDLKLLVPALQERLQNDKKAKGLTRWLRPRL